MYGVTIHFEIIYIDIEEEEEEEEGAELKEKKD